MYQGGRPFGSSVVIGEVIEWCLIFDQSPSVKMGKVGICSLNIALIDPHLVEVSSAVLWIKLELYGYLIVTAPISARSNVDPFVFDILCASDVIKVAEHT